MSRPKKPGGTGDGLPVVGVRFELETIQWLKAHTQIIGVSVAEYIRSLVIGRKKVFDAILLKSQNKIPYERDFSGLQDISNNEAIGYRKKLLRHLKTEFRRVEKEIDTNLVRERQIGKKRINLEFDFEYDNEMNSLREERDYYKGLILKVKDNIEHMEKELKQLLMESCDNKAERIR